MVESPLDIPLKAPHVLAQMEQTHVNAKVTPNDDKSLSFSVAVPKAWGLSRQFGPVPTGIFQGQGLGFFAAGAAPGAPVIAVTVTPLVFEVPIDRWARLAFAQEGWDVVAGHWFPGPHGLFFDLTGVRTTTGKVHEVRRTTVRLDGSRLFSVNCLCAREHWDAVKEIFWAAHSTFELLGGTKATRIEPWLTAVAAHRPSFELAYPRSWAFEEVAAPEGVSGVDLRLADAKHERLLAYLQVKAEETAVGKPVPALAELQAEALAKLKKAGFEPSGPRQPVPEGDNPRAAAVEGRLGGGIAQGRLGGTDVVSRLDFVRRGGTILVLSLLSPTFHDDTMVAMRAQRAFEIARQTMRVR